MENRPNIETNRLILRPFDLSDAQMVQKYAGDFSVADTTLNVPHPYQIAIAEEWISIHQEKYEKRELINYAITLKPKDVIIGCIGLGLYNKRFDIYELGYWIGKPFWNKGICTEAAKALIKYGFEKHKIHKIIATHILRNPASGKVMKKAGMKLEGTFKEQVKKWDVWEDIISYGIIRSEWNNPM